MAAVRKMDVERMLDKIVDIQARRDFLRDAVLAGTTKVPEHIRVAIDRLVEDRKFGQAAELSEDLGYFHQAVHYYAEDGQDSRAQELADRIGMVKRY